jgi:hypothetical protein
MNDDESWRDALADLVRQVGTALVSQLEGEVREQLVQRLETPVLKDRHAAVQYVQDALELETEQFPPSERSTLTPLLKRTLELADSKDFVEELIQTLETRGLSPVQRLVLLNSLTPNSGVEIQFFGRPAESVQEGGLRLVKDDDPEPSP